MTEFTHAATRFSWSKCTKNMFTLLFITIISRRINEFQTHFWTLPFLTTHHPFLITIFSKCKSPCSSLFVTLLLVIPAQVQILSTLVTFLKNHINRSWKFKPKKCNFRPSRTVRLEVSSLFIIYTILYSDFPFLSCRSYYNGRKNWTFSLI